MIGTLPLVYIRTARIIPEYKPTIDVKEWGCLHLSNFKTLIYPPQNFEKHIRLPPYRDRGSSRSASARRRGGDKFESRAVTAS